MKDAKPDPGIGFVGCIFACTLQELGFQDRGYLQYRLSVVVRHFIDGVRSRDGVRQNGLPLSYYYDLGRDTPALPGEKADWQRETM